MLRDSSMKLAIFGATGMLGSMLLKFFTKETHTEILSISRKKAPSIDPAAWRYMDAGRVERKELLNILDDVSWAVNAIGVIKPHIHDDVDSEVERAVRINALFPHVLARVAEETNCRVIQIATDCVYSGLRGKYVETDLHDPQDVYGKTKSLGEVFSPNVYHLKCSIVGHQEVGGRSLLQWFLNQDRGAEVIGFTNHFWNGVTTLHFAKICNGIMGGNLQLPHVQHLIPNDVNTKYELLNNFAASFDRRDITIKSTKATKSIDRTLSTANPELNRKMWQAAGYNEPPTIKSMIAELARFDCITNTELA
jgi:dTDP-4-dehydrorhamnose reductase